MRLNPGNKLVKLARGGGKGKDSLWPLVKEALELGMEARRPFEQMWIVNLAFLMGRQYTFFNLSAHTLQELKKVPGKVRVVDNQILPKWKRQVSDLIKNRPKMSVVPNTLDDEDIKAAKMGDKVLEHWWRASGMQKKIRKLGGWIYTTGNGFLDDRWDEKKGPVTVGEDGKLYYEGDVSCGVWSPFQIVVPFTVFGQSELDEFPWLIKLNWMPISEFEQFKDGKKVKEEELTSPFVKLSGVMTGFGQLNSNKEPGALLISYYRKPDADFPKGLFVKAANGVILDKQDYPFDTYNLEQFKDIDIPGVFWGMATMQQAIPLQKMWNRTVGDIHEFNRVSAKGKLLNPKGSGLTQAPDDTHGEILNYKPVMGHKPELLTLKGLPATYERILEVVQYSMENLFSQHEVSRGTNKSDIRSGSMVQLLLEQDSQGLVQSHSVFEESLERLGSRILKRIQVGYKDQRTLKVVGKDGEFDLIAFKGADLRGNTDVTVKRQSSLPDSRALREAMVLERYQQGLYGDPKDPEVRRQVMNMLEDAVVKDVYADTRRDEAYARFENKLLSTKEIDLLLVNSYDNHGVHVKEHNHYRKSMEFQKLKISSPDLFALLDSRIEKHVMVHQQYINQAMMQAAQMQLMMEGGEKNGNRTSRSMERPRSRTSQSKK